MLHEERAETSQKSEMEQNQPKQSIVESEADRQSRAGAIRIRNGTTERLRR
jgi:hypothetical protein